MEQQYTPPFTMTDRIIEKISEISELVGRITTWQDMNANLKLRRENRIKTIHSSLAIENNSLSLDHIRTLILIQCVSMLAFLFYARKACVYRLFGIFTGI